MRNWAIRADFVGGVTLVAIGGFALWLAQRLPMGTWARMGSGFVPRSMAVIVIGFGIAIMIRGLFNRDTLAASTNAIRPLIAICLAMVVFGLLIESAGLIAACIGCVVIAAFGGRDIRPLEIGVVAVTAAAVAAAVFVGLLRLNFALLPQ